MSKRFVVFLLALSSAGALIYSASCGEDSCQIRVDAPGEGDPIPVTICATCNKGKDAQGAEPIDVEFVPNDPDVGCRCVAASCVLCLEDDDCDDTDCDIQVDTDEASGCTEPAISLELDGEDFAEGARIPVTIEARSRFGNATRVVHMSRGTPTPTPTATPTSTPTRTPTTGLPLPLP